MERVDVEAMEAVHARSRRPRRRRMRRPRCRSREHEDGAAHQSDTTVSPSRPTARRMRRQDRRARDRKAERAELQEGAEEGRPGHRHPDGRRRGPELPDPKSGLDTKAARRTRCWAPRCRLAHADSGPNTTTLTRHHIEPLRAGPRDAKGAEYTKRPLVPYCQTDGLSPKHYAMTTRLAPEPHDDYPREGRSGQAESAPIRPDPHGQSAQDEAAVPMSPRLPPRIQPPRSRPTHQPAVKPSPRSHRRLTTRRP